MCPFNIIPKNCHSFTEWCAFGSYMTWIMESQGIRRREVEQSPLALNWLKIHPLCSQWLRTTPPFNHLHSMMRKVRKHEVVHEAITFSAPLVICSSFLPTQKNIPDKSPKEIILNPSHSQHPVQNLDHALMVSSLNADMILPELEMYALKQAHFSLHFHAQKPIKKRQQNNHRGHSHNNRRKAEVTT